MKSPFCIILFASILFLLSPLSGISQWHAFALGKAPSTLQVLGEGFVTTTMNERDFALSPDGKEMYFTVSTPNSTFQTIVYSRQVSVGEWTAPEIVSFAGKYSDLEPSFSSDGQTLYFASNRPLSGVATKDFDLWKVQRSATGWSEPINLGSPVNTDGDEFYPSVTKNGNLYYTASYKGGPGREDIYMSAYKDNAYHLPIALDTAINTKFYEFNAFVDPNEQYILFTSYGRKDDMGGGDLYISVKNKEGKWQTAQNVTSLNSKQLDYCPYVSPDGKSLFITSNRHNLTTSFDKRTNYQNIQSAWTSYLNGSGNIYWIDFKEMLGQVKPVH